MKAKVIQYIEDTDGHRFNNSPKTWKERNYDYEEGYSCLIKKRFGRFKIQFMGLSGLQTIILYPAGIKRINLIDKLPDCEYCEDRGYTYGFKGSEIKCYKCSN